MLKISIILLLSAILGLAPLAGDGNISPLRQIENALSGQIVDVVYFLKYDALGNVPSAAGLFCVSCNDFHDRNLGELLANHRNLQVSGVMVAENLVLTADLFIDPQGVEKLEVRFKNNSVPAVIKTVYPDQGALLLELSRPLPGTRAAVCKVDLSGKLFAYSRIMENGRWVSRLRPFSAQQEEQLYSPDRNSYSIPGNSLIVNARGEISAIMTNTNETIAPVSWNLPWTQWRGIAEKDFLQRKKQLEKHLQKSILPATIYFKSWTLSRREKLLGVTPLREVFSYAYKLPDGSVIMPVLTSPKQNELIEKIVLHAPGRNIPCAIGRVMKNYGGIVLELPPEAQKALPALAPRTASLEKEFGMMVWSVAITAYNKSLDIKLYSDILAALTTGLTGHLCAVPLKKSDLADLIFDLHGDLLGINMSVRAFNYNRQWPVIGAAEVEKLLAAPGETILRKDMCNPPDGVAFPGVEYQPMTRELAQSLNLEHLTQQGREGLLITHIYKNSPAEKLHWQTGDVLLKILPPTGGPIALTGKKFAYPQEQQFPWEKLDSIPEMYYGEIPEPWRGIKTPLNNQLTTIGIGQNVEFIIIHKGKVLRSKWQITNAPPYFEIAPAYRSSSLGAEVRNLTFEVRHYFRMLPQQPGVIVGNVSAGSPAATAGLKPFEIITAVNDKDIFNIKDFQKAVYNVPEIRLTVRRLGTNRVVTVRPNMGPRR